MRRETWLLSFFILLCCPIYSHAQTPLWSGILNPTYGTGACNPSEVATPSACGIDWSHAGTNITLPVQGPPSGWTQVGSTVQASACSNGSVDCTSTIQTALKACTATSLPGQYVQLGSGTFLIDGTVTISNYCALAGMGANQTILNDEGTSNTSPVVLGGSSAGTSYDTAITSGASAGSTSIVVASTAHISTGAIMQISELNEYDPLVSILSDQADSGDYCTFCDNYGGTRVVRQTVLATNVSGSTVTITPALYRNMNNKLPDWSSSAQYSAAAFINPSTQPTHYYEQTTEIYTGSLRCVPGGTEPTWPTNGTSVSDGTCNWTDKGLGTTTQPLASPYTATYYAGLTALQIVNNNTRCSGGESNCANVLVSGCAYCWVTGIETNYESGNWIDLEWSVYVSILNNYFSNSYYHGAGSYDSNVFVAQGTSASLIQNNIMERGHDDAMFDWGPSGNVESYNFMQGEFSTSTPNLIGNTISMHGAHPEFNLLEGNILTRFVPDSIHGSSSHNTLFRNWVRGAETLCNPMANARETVVCSPFGTYGGSYNSWFPYQMPWLLEIDILSSNYNFVGDILGSSNLASIGDGTEHAIVSAICGVSPCGAGTMGYQVLIDIKLGASSVTGTGGAAADSVIPYNTMFLHGTYTHGNTTTNWVPGVTHTLPASFYLSSEPTTWWAPGIPWPPIGPDVTGGLSEGFGYVNMNPAMNCYMNVMGGVAGGAGSPLTFNANSCYPIAPPTGPGAAAH